MTPEQQKAVAIAKARRRRSKATTTPTAPPISGQMQPATQIEAKAGQIAGRQQTGFETGLQATALGLEYIFNTAAQTVGEYIPEGMKTYGKNAIKSMANAAKPALKTPTGQIGLMALKSGGEQWDSFKQAHPRFAADIEATAAIGFTAMMGARPASKLVRKATWGRWDFVDEMVKPFKLKDVDLRSMTTEGVKGKAVINLTPDQKQMANALKTVPGLKRGNSHARNYEYIRDHNIQSAQKLQWKLHNNQTPVRRQEVLKTLNKAVNDFDSNFLKSKRMSADEKLTFIDDTLDKLGNVSTTGKLLEARKAADAQFRMFSNDRRMQGLNIPTRDEIKWRATRDALNGLLEKLEPGYQSEVRRQHMMYKSLDVLEDKVKAEMEAAGQKQIFGGKAAKQVRALISPRIR